MNVRLAKLVTTYVDRPLGWWAIALAGDAAARVRPSAALALARGHAYERLGRHDAARMRYVEAVERARRSDRRSEIAWLHAASFLEQRALRALGLPHVDDPLLGCTLTPDAGERERAAAGRFTGEIGVSGLRLYGFADPDVDAVVIELDGLPLRSTATSSGRRRAFTYVIAPDALASFPPDGRVRVRAGQRLLRVGRAGWALRAAVPFGDGSLVEALHGGRTLDKKGSLPRDEAARAERRRAYLDLYRRARAAFTAYVGRDLFLMYGTLLGAWREGDLIAGDDDVDVGYLSDAVTTNAVMGETVEVIRALLAAGFDVSFNRRGRLFRLADAGAARAGVHLDVRPVWFEQGRAWAHNHFSMPSRRDAWEPFQEGRLGDVAVMLPRDPEPFLAFQYGPGWRTPDPGFTYRREDVPEAVHRHLAKTLLTPLEYHELRERFDGARSAGWGRFRAASWEPLYRQDPGAPR